MAAVGKGICVLYMGLIRNDAKVVEALLRIKDVPNQASGRKRNRCLKFQRSKPKLLIFILI